MGRECSVLLQDGFIPVQHSKAARISASRHLDRQIKCPEIFKSWKKANFKAVEVYMSLSRYQSAGFYFELSTLSVTDTKGNLLTKKFLMFTCKLNFHTVNDFKILGESSDFIKQKPMFFSFC